MLFKTWISIWKHRAPQPDSGLASLPGHCFGDELAKQKSKGKWWSVRESEERALWFCVEINVAQKAHTMCLSAQAAMTRITNWELKQQTGFSDGSVIKNPHDKAGDTGDLGSISVLGRSPGGGHGNPLQYSCLENPMDRGAMVTIHGITKSQTRLNG